MVCLFCLSRPYPFNFFKGSLPQNLLSPLLNTLSHIFDKFQIFSKTQKMPSEAATGGGL